MQKNKPLFKKAFSLIELSIVSLVIMSLLVGVPQGVRLVRNFKISVAKTQTQSSPVAGIKNLALWLEATAENSFGGSGPENNSGVQTWVDTSPQAVSRFSAVQNNTLKQPTYLSDGINGLPALKFDGADDDMAMAGFSAGSNTSYFFVVQPAAAQVEAIFDSAPNQPQVFRNLCDEPNYPTCTGDGAFSWWTGTNPTPQVTLGLAANAPYVIYVETKLSPSRVINYYRNGVFVSTSSHASTTNTTWNNPKIGSVNDTLKFYNGKIGEIIVFDRTLQTEERNSIADYLGKKWGIKVF
ncbi:MAG: hypothetical protein KA100_06685 [Rickettsiales bacterium]|nr:hypothetical protein [Rickettsiales bacterium]